MFDRSEAVDDFEAVVVVLLSLEGWIFVRNDKRGWEFPGGHCEGSESYHETVAREVYEETGLRVPAIESLSYHAIGENHIAVIVCAQEGSKALKRKELDPSRVAAFAGLPDALSFGDGRERMILSHAARQRYGVCRNASIEPESPGG